MYTRDVLEENLCCLLSHLTLAFLYLFVFSASPGQVTFFCIVEAHYCKYSVALVLTKQTGLLKSKLLLVYLPSLLILLGTGSVVELLVYTSCLKKI